MSQEWLDRHLHQLKCIGIEPSVVVRDGAAGKAARVVAGSVEWPGELGLSYDTAVSGKPADRRTCRCGPSSSGWPSG